MNLNRKWGYILMFLLTVHLPVQINAQGNQKKILKTLSNLLDEKITDFLENQMPIILEDTLPKIVGEKIEDYVMERFDILEEHLRKLKAVCNSNCTSGNCTCDQDGNGYQCDLGEWSSWTSWGVCTATCGGGQRQRSRTCSKMAISHGDQTCPGSSSEYENCNQDTCPHNECQEGFLSMTNSTRCFSVLDDEVTWDEAQKKCQQIGLQLAKNIDDIAIPLRKYILDTYGDGNPVWINARGSDGSGGLDNYLWQEEGVGQQHQLNTAAADKTMLHTLERGRGGTEYCLGLLVWEYRWTTEPGHPYGVGYCAHNRVFPLCEMINE